MEELTRHPPTHNEFGVHDDMFTLITFNRVDQRPGDKAHQVFTIQKCTLDDWSLKIIDRTLMNSNCPTCLKVMPVQFSCPNCNGEPAQVLHCVTEPLEVSFQGERKTTRSAAGPSWKTQRIFHRQLRFV